MKTDTEQPARPKSEFLVALRNGALLGIVVLAIAIPWMRMKQKAEAPPPPVAQVTPAPQPAPAPVQPEAPAAPTAPATEAAPADPATAGKAPDAAAPSDSAAAAAPKAPAAPPAAVARGPKSGPLPDFGKEVPTADVKHVANWAFFTRDNQGKSVVILDKKDARVWAFAPDGKLKAVTPALLGAAIGDDSAPGIGDKPLSQIKPEEKTTPAGRFVAEPGINTKGEDIVWVDYDAAVSMHRVRPAVAAERRLERLASITEKDNRISFGCINLPVKFYEQVLSPTVKKTGAIVYVLPETRSVEKTFKSWDVTDPAQVARRAAGKQQVALAKTGGARDARQNRDVQ